MNASIGTEVYNTDAGSVVARGMSYSQAELNDALGGAIRNLVEDVEGKRRIREALESVTLTDFQKDRLEAILNVDPGILDWEVGEALAEAHVTTCCGCQFPWPDKWDQRKNRSSLPGADLAGLELVNDEQRDFRFAFGEIKTSEDDRHPPGNMYGRHGLKAQLEDLRNNEEIRNTLFVYLGHRASGASWHLQYQSAAARYLADHTDVAIFGVLIRDVAPHEDDLKARSRSLADGQPQSMGIQLLAIYLPAGSIAHFRTHYARSEEGANAGG